jgi:hypothetical protein
MNISITIKIILTILFLLCLLQMPYGYYQIVRFVGMAGFIVLAFLRYQQNKTVNLEVIIYAFLALLFQPFIKIALGRAVWNIVDLIVSLWLIISLFLNPKKV